MVKTVTLELKWLPKDVGSLFYDDIDHRGLVYWYNAVNAMIKKIETPTPKANS